MPQATAAKTAAKSNPQATTTPAVRTPSAIISGRPGAPDITIPVTQSDVDVLLSRRSELGTQLNSANDRRNTLSRQLRSAKEGPDRTGIEMRISQLDNRIISIEADMDQVGRALSAAPSGLVVQTNTSSSTGSPPRNFGQPSAGQITGLGVVFMFAVLMPLSISISRAISRRFSHPPAPQIPREVIDRLDRMEQGIDAVAVEVERIGEGQRFVTQLMGDRAKREALPESVPRT